jgi:hypothetical protein
MTRSLLYFILALAVATLVADMVFVVQPTSTKGEGFSGSQISSAFASIGYGLAVFFFPAIHCEWHVISIKRQAHPNLVDTSHLGLFRRAGEWAPAHLNLFTWATIFTYWTCFPSFCPRHLEVGDR